MLKRRRKLLKSERHPQKFLQYGINEDRFINILRNESDSSVLHVAPILPSGFKPLSSSTPKRSRKSFEIIDKSSRTRLSPHLKMSQFIGEIPHPPELIQNTIRSPNRKNVNIIEELGSNDIETNISNDITPPIIWTPRRRRRSASCESWKTFQSQLQKCLSLTVRDMSTAEKILNLIFQINLQNNNHEENVQIFKNYVKIKALMKASEASYDLNLSKEVCSDSIEASDDVDKNIKFELSAKNDGSFKVSETPGSLKPHKNRQKRNSNTKRNQCSKREYFDFNEISEQMQASNRSVLDPIENSSQFQDELQELLKPATGRRTHHKTDSEVCTSKDCEIVIADDGNLAPTANGNPQPYNYSYSKTTEDILQPILQFKSFARNNNSSRKKPLNVFENFVDSKTSKIISRTFDESNIFKEILPNSNESDIFFDQSNSSSKNCGSMKVRNSPILTKASKPRKPCFRNKRNQDHTKAASPYFDLNSILQASDKGSITGNSQLEKEIQKFLNITTHGRQQQCYKHSSNDDEIYSNDLKTSGNGKSSHHSFSNINITADILNSIFQFDSSSKNYKRQKNHPGEDNFFEIFNDSKVSTMMALSQTIDDVNYFDGIFGNEEISCKNDDQSMLFSKEFGSFMKHNFVLNQQNREIHV